MSELTRLTEFRGYPVKVQTNVEDLKKMYPYIRKMFAGVKFRNEAKQHRYGLKNDVVVIIKEVELRNEHLYFHIHHLFDEPVDNAKSYILNRLAKWFGIGHTRISYVYHRAKHDAFESY
jgi:hypothetical protein